MSKKSKPAGGSVKSKGSMSAIDHRKVAETLQARARLHHAKADLMDAKNPPKKGSNRYPYC